MQESPFASSAPRRMLTPLALVLPLLVARPVQSPESIRAWSEDALFLVEELERRHPDPWFGCPREDFDQAMDTFITGLEGWDEPHATAEFLRLFARLSWQGREGHATVWPISSNALPVQLYGFVDGWYVVAADEPALVGARVQAVAGVPIDELCARLAPLLTRDNDWNLRAKLPMALTNAELLAGVGLALPPQGIALTLVREGRSEERVLVPSAEARGFWHHSPLPARAGTHWLEGTDQAFRLEVLAPERTLYVQYNVSVRARF